MGYILFYSSLPILPSLILTAIIVLLLRKWIRENQTARIVLTVTLTVVGCLLSFVLAATLLANITAGVADYYSTVINIEPQDRNDVIRELVLREVVPDVFRPACITTEAICKLADEVVYAGSAGQRMTQGSFPTILQIIGLVAAVLNGALFWYYTRSKSTPEPITPPIAAG